MVRRPLCGTPLALKHVLWIGGPAGSGKTSVATRLARRHGLRWYGADTRTWEHRDRALRAGNPAALQWEALTPTERWSGTDDELLAMSLHRERGPMIVDDLSRLPPSPLVVAEGTPVSPSLVDDPARAIWLLPTPAFRRARLAQRDLPPGTARLYRLVAAEIEREAREHGAAVLPVDGSRDVAATVDAIEALFADALAAGPRAESLRELTALLREANEAVVNQVRGYYARPWAEGDPERVVRTFVCECGDPSCEADLERPVAAAATAPLLAPGHG